MLSVDKHIFLILLLLSFLCCEVMLVIENEAGGAFSGVHNCTTILVKEIMLSLEPHLFLITLANINFLSMCNCVFISIAKQCLVVAFLGSLVWNDARSPLALS